VGHNVSASFYSVVWCSHDDSLTVEMTSIDNMVGFMLGG
jgi:hypothetical protein